MKVGGCGTHVHQTVTELVESVARLKVRRMTDDELREYITGEEVNARFTRLRLEGRTSDDSLAVAEMLAAIKEAQRRGLRV